MAPGSFTDSGYRFRRNIFDRKDHWIPYYEDFQHIYYDVLLFNSDTLRVGDDYMKIAEMFFRLHESQNWS